MYLKHLIQYLEERVPLHLQEEYDNSGLLLGDLAQEVHKGLLALDATEEVILEALDIGADLVITHHPIIFGGLKSINRGFSSHRAITLALEKHIAVYAIHTNLDKVHGGVSFQIAEILGLDQISFLRKSTSPQSGLGVVGYFQKPIPWNECAEMLKNKMKTKVIRHTKDNGQLISRIGLCGGSGSDLLPDAIQSACDLYISADFKYHQFFRENSYMMIADIGHYESEQFSPLLIHQIISKKFPTFALSLSKKDTNPIYYSY
jgi:dinuclear metal center YbgI/SA1388 family protein